jgi:hypothetical protein
VETVEIFLTELTVPFQSSRDLATEAANQLAYALGNPQPVGPFAQVGDEQVIALKKMAAIFEGALPKHRQRTATPLLNKYINSPPRVDITESPQRENQPASDPRVAVPTASNQMAQNYHRRSQTTPRRFFTSTTLNHMTRRITGSLNFSQDML